MIAALFVAAGGVYSGLPVLIPGTRPATATPIKFRDVLLSIAASARLAIGLAPGDP